MDGGASLGRRHKTSARTPAWEKGMKGLACVGPAGLQVCPPLRRSRAGASVHGALHASPAKELRVISATHGPPRGRGTRLTGHSSWSGSAWVTTRLSRPSQNGVVAVEKSLVAGGIERSDHPVALLSALTGYDAMMGCARALETR